MREFNSAAHALQMRHQGFWTDNTIDDFFVDAVAKYPD